MADARNTQEMVGDLFGGLASLGAHGVDALVVARTMARLLVRKGILDEDEMIQIMREIVTEEIEKSDTIFVAEAYKEILARLDSSDGSSSDNP